KADAWASAAAESARMVEGVGMGRIVRETARIKQCIVGRFAPFVRSRLLLIWLGGYPMENKKNSQNSMTQSQALLALLTAQGLLEDGSIPDEERRKAQRERLQKLYHNTQVLLS